MLGSLAQIPFSMSLVSNLGPRSTPHYWYREHAPMLLKARCHRGDTSGPNTWEEVHSDGDPTIRRESRDGWRTGHFSSGSGPAAATGRNNADGGLLDHPCARLGKKRNRSSKRDGRAGTVHGRGQQEGPKFSCTALTVGPLQVSSVALRPYAHGELYRRPPQRTSGRKPLMAPAATRSSSLAPLKPQSFAPRLLDKEALCVGNGVSRGASLTSQATALRQKQLQFRHRLHKSTHKSAGLVRLIAVMREDGSPIS
ncbi:unnamed protein product [Pylaiella littoralis]